MYFSGCINKLLEYINSGFFEVGLEYSLPSGNSNFLGTASGDAQHIYIQMWSI